LLHQQPCVVGNHVTVKLTRHAWSLAIIHNCHA